MPYQRFQFNCGYDTGDGTAARGDTGAPIWGEVCQVRWAPTDGDTGGDLTLALLPRTGDSGDGFSIVERADCLATNFLWMPSQQLNHTDGRDTGATTEGRFVAAGDRLRVKFTPGRDTCAGRLYVYIKQ